MKVLYLLYCLALLICLSCSDDQRNNNPNMLEAEVVISDGTCCSNLNILNQEKVFSPLENRSDDYLAGNIDSFIDDLGLVIGDALRIQFEFTLEKTIPCDIICNRDNGLRIVVLSLEKI